MKIPLIAEIGTQKDVVTQEPTSSPLAVRVDKKGFHKEDAVTEEPTSSELIVEVHLQA